MKHLKKQHLTALIVGGVLFAIAAPGFAGNGGHDMAGMNHDGVQRMAGMENMQGKKALPEEQEVDGVKAMFHLMPIDAGALPAGQQATHHLMVMFNDAKSGKQLAGGTVAVKITDPGQVEAKPVKMMGMQGHFGVDVNLDRPGVWHFRIAAKLADGKVRQFHSHYVVK